MITSEILEKLRVPADKKIKLKDYETGWAITSELKNAGKEAAKLQAVAVLDQNRAELAEAQQLLYAANSYAVLILLQAMDSAGKDSTIKHVMSGVNPQGCQVFSFKQPSAEELDHDFLWRCSRNLPERGRIGIFNRSYYEEVLIAKVHPEILDAQRLPPGKRGDSFWNARYDDINAFERHLVRNGTLILKFFLHLSKDEQKKRFLERLDNPSKNWKFSPTDIAARAQWTDYQKAYEEALSATSTKWAPWHVIPADQKWAARTLVSDIITSSIRHLDLSYPKPSPETLAQLAEARQTLESE